MASTVKYGLSIVSKLELRYQLVKTNKHHKLLNTDIDVYLWRLREHYLTNFMFVGTLEFQTRASSGWFNLLPTLSSLPIKKIQRVLNWVCSYGFDLKNAGFVHAMVAFDWTSESTRER